MYIRCISLSYFSKSPNEETESPLIAGVKITLLKPNKIDKLTTEGKKFNPKNT